MLRLKVIALVICFLLIGVGIGATIIGPMIISSEITSFKTSYSTKVTTNYFTITSTSTIIKKTTETLTITSTLILNVDSDNDGLTDYLEAKLGTNPNDADSDDDRLTDGEEATLYDTDPLDTDSDNDNISDADEIRYGTNPKSMDSDQDGLSDYREITLDLNPVKPNPVINYSLGLLPQEIAFKLLPLDEDSKMDFREKQFINLLALQPLTIQSKIVNSSIVTDGNISSNELLFMKFIENSTEVIPEHIRKMYYTEGELLTIKLNLVNAVLSNKIVSQKEIDALKSLFKMKRWNIIRDVINSKIISDEILDQDSDDDNISNYKEILQGTNPLNSLEKSPDNLSERYLILINGLDRADIDESAEAILLVYHLARRNGYDDDHLIVFLNLRNLDVKKVIGDNLLWKQSWSCLDLLNDIAEIKQDYRDEKVNFKNIVSAIKSLALKIDSNDEVIIYFDGHGWERFSLNKDEALEYYHFNDLLSRLKNGRKVIILSSCSSEYIIRRLDQSKSGINTISNTLGIATALEHQLASGGFGPWLFEFMDHGYSLLKAGTKIEKHLKSKNACGAFVRYYFTKEGAPYPKCPWIYNYNVFHYMPIDKDYMETNIINLQGRVKIINSHNFKLSISNKGDLPQIISKIIIYEIPIELRNGVRYVAWRHLRIFASLEALNIVIGANKEQEVTLTIENAEFKRANEAMYVFIVSTKGGDTVINISWDFGYSLWSTY